MHDNPKPQQCSKGATHSSTEQHNKSQIQRAASEQGFSTRARISASERANNDSASERASSRNLKRIWGPSHCSLWHGEDNARKLSCPHGRARRGCPWKHVAERDFPLPEQPCPSYCCSHSRSSAQSLVACTSSLPYYMHLNQPLTTLFATRLDCRPFFFLRVILALLSHRRRSAATVGFSSACLLVILFVCVFSSASWTCFPIGYNFCKLGNPRR